MKTIAIIAAHPDDEALGCGGFLIKEKKQGSIIHLLFMTNGISARINSTPKDLFTRQQNLNSAINFIQPSSHQQLDLPDNKMDTIPLLEIVQNIETFIEKTAPDIILTHFINDLNIDHTLTCRAVITATRPGSKTYVKEIYSFEVPSATEWTTDNSRFSPDTYVNISNYIEEKKNYLNCYINEIKPHPSSRSMQNIMALNQIRGAQINTNYAEAFVTLRRVIDK